MSPTYIIAEAGVNHNGSLDLAKNLVDVAKQAGADAVKFQTFQTGSLVSKYAKKAEYQQKQTDVAESQMEMLQNLELSHEDHLTLVNYCQQKEISFLSTPFDHQSAKFLIDDIQIPLVKIPSGEITNGPLILDIARSQKPLIVSTGMSTLGEIEDALSVIAYGYLNTAGHPTPESLLKAYQSNEGQSLLRERVTLLHCVTEYPAPISETNLHAMQTLQNAFGLSVGLSDHSITTSIPIGAVAMGASLIEKHFTTDKNLPGPDHQASLSPEELGQMIQGIRDVEQALGSSTKAPGVSEFKNRNIARKSLIAKSPIKEGAVFTDQNLTYKRPGNGISPMKYWQYVGQKSQYSYETDQLIEE